MDKVVKPNILFWTKHSVQRIQFLTILVQLFGPMDKNLVTEMLQIQIMFAVNAKYGCGGIDIDFIKFCYI